MLTLFENEKTHALGHRAFYFFLSSRMKSIIFWIVVAVAAWYAKGWVPADYMSQAITTLTIILTLCGAIVFFILLQAWLEYRYYTYTFTREAFIVTHGVILRQETAALYHQIQNVSIQRSVVNRLVGLSEILIFLDGDESGHAKVRLPAVHKHKAKMVQKELLARARKSAGL